MQRYKTLGRRIGLTFLAMYFAIITLGLPEVMAQNTPSEQEKSDTKPTAASALPGEWAETSGSRHEWFSGNTRFVIADVSREGAGSGQAKERGLLFVTAYDKEAEHRVILRHEDMQGFEQPRSLLSEWLKRTGGEANRTFKLLTDLVKTQMTETSALRRQAALKFLGNQGSLLTDFLAQIIKNGGHDSKRKLIAYAQRGVDVSIHPGRLADKVYQILKDTTKDDPLATGALYLAILNTEKTAPLPVTGPLVPPRGGRAAPRWSLQSCDLLLLWRNGNLSKAPEACRIAVYLNGGEGSSSVVTVSENNTVRLDTLENVLSSATVVVALRNKDLSVRQRSRIARFLHNHVDKSQYRVDKIEPPRVRAMKREAILSDLGFGTDTWTCSGLFLEAFQEAGAPITLPNRSEPNHSEVPLQNDNLTFEYVGHLKY